MSLFNQLGCAGVCSIDEHRFAAISGGPVMSNRHPNFIGLADCLTGGSHRTTDTANLASTAALELLLHSACATTACAVGDVGG